MLSVFLASELANLKKISHFVKVPTDPASDTHAEDARIFNLLNFVMCLPVSVSTEFARLAYSNKPAHSCALKI